MAYIVPGEIPESCANCPFHGCRFSHPFWATDAGDLCGKQGFYCQLDTETPRRIMIVDFGDNTSKAEWCPLKKIVECKNCINAKVNYLQNGLCLCEKEIFERGNGVKPINLVMCETDFCSDGKPRESENKC